MRHMKYLYISLAFILLCAEGARGQQSGISGGDSTRADTARKSMQADSSGKHGRATVAHTPATVRRMAKPVVKTKKDSSAIAVPVKKDSVRIVAIPDTVQADLLKKAIVAALAPMLKKEIPAPAPEGRSFLFSVLLSFLLLGLATAWYQIVLLGKISKQIREVPGGGGKVIGAGVPAAGGNAEARVEAKIADAMTEDVVDAIAKDLAGEVRVALNSGVTESTACFVSEIMMTAGPRKKAMKEPGSDKDLGEDICGFVARAGRIGFWLLDGTSDNYILRENHFGKEYFSSRLLAQCIADYLRKAIVAGGAGELSLNEIINETIREVKRDWLLNIGALSTQEKERLRINILGKKFPECSTTLLLAILDLNGDLAAYRSGDSKMLLFRNEEKGLISVDSSF